MAKPMGYYNSKRVREMAKSGAFTIPRGDSATTWDAAARVLETMASLVIDPEDDESRKEGKPFRLYYGGTRLLVEELGWLAFTKEEKQRMLSSDDATAADMVERKVQSQIVRLSKIIGWLEQKGYLKKLRNQNSLASRNAVWMLMLGTPEENNKIEQENRMWLQYGKAR